VPSYTRLLGAATAGYSVALLVRPQVLLKPVGLPDTAEGRLLARSMGARDAVSGITMMLAPAGATRRAAVAARAAADWADGASFGAALAGQPTRRKAVGWAAAWGTLCALGLLLDEKRS
jgi:hypothetical protein